MDHRLVLRHHFLPGRAVGFFPTIDIELLALQIHAAGRQVIDIDFHIRIIGGHVDHLHVRVKSGGARAIVHMHPILIGHAGELEFLFHGLRGHFGRRRGRQCFAFDA